MIKIKVKRGNRSLGGAAVLIIDENKRVLILKRPPGINWAPDVWGLPGGAIEPGETPAEAAVRETKEETTLDVRDLKDLKLTLDKGLHVYYTSKYSGKVQIDFEHEDWRWVSRNEIENYDLVPRLLDMYDWVLKYG